MDGSSKSVRVVRFVARHLRLGTFLPLNLTLRLYGGTDKLNHNYGHYYHTHLKKRRLRTKRVMEIGVGGYELKSLGGDSLRVWRDYFPFAKIAGLDIHEKAIDLGRRVSISLGDQVDHASLDLVISQLGGAPEIVIDDGSHLSGHAKATFDYLFPLMPAGSLYIIEDLHTSYWDGFGGSVPAGKETSVGLVCSLIDDVQRSDPTFARWAANGHYPTPPGRDCVENVDIYPGIVFIKKG